MKLKLVTHKKGLAFTAVILLVLLAMLSFVTVHHILSIKEEKSKAIHVSSSNIYTALSSYEDSLSSVINHKGGFSSSYKSQIQSYSGSVYAIYNVSLTAVLASESLPNAVLSSEVSRISSVASILYPSIQVNLSSKPYYFSNDIGLYCYFNDSNSTISKGEEFVFYYNKSGLSIIPIKNISITLNVNVTNINPNYIARNISTPSELKTYDASKIRVLLYLNDVNFPTYEPEQIENLTILYLPITTPASLYVINITTLDVGSNRFPPLLNITVDNEKLIFRTDYYNATNTQTLKIDIGYDVTNFSDTSFRWYIDNQYVLYSISNSRGSIIREPFID